MGSVMGSIDPSIHYYHLSLGHSHCFGFTRTVNSPSCMPYPTMARQAILHRGFCANICDSVVPGGLSNSMPRTMDTEQVAHVPSAPQSQVQPLSNRRASGSLSLMPRT